MVLWLLIMLIPTWLGRGVTPSAARPMIFPRIVLVSATKVIPT